MDAAEILHRLIVVPLLRKVSYVTDARKLVGELEERFEYLKYRCEDIISAIAAEEAAAGRRRTRQVEMWLQQVQGIETEVTSIGQKFESQRCRFSGNICSTYKIARKASRILVEVKDLDEKGRHIGDVTREFRPPPGQEMPATSYLKIMESNLEKVQGHLAAGEATVGILGMGGVGKTTLLATIHDTFCVADTSCDVCFEHVIWVVVSRDASTGRLQGEIAKALKLTLMDGAQAMRDAIFNFLKKEKFLLLLDDVREPLDLNALGIPDRGRTLIFTTRSENVCRRMEARAIVKVECLEKDAAWRLFKRAVGDEVIMRNPDVERLAKKVANQCLGLPLALIVVSRTMTAKRTSTILEGVSSCTRTRGEWALALDSLKKSRRSPLDQEYVILSILKHGYDSLEDDISRQCFLCCALFPEHCDIPEEDLMECFSGHGLIDPWDFHDIGGAHDYGRRIIEALLSSCLLETSEEGGERMHDVVRDMALWIARDCGENDIKWVVRAGLDSTEPLKGVDDWEMADRVSLMYNEMEVLPEPKIKRCPNLSTLMLGHNPALETIPSKFFKRFPVLTYLDLSNTSIASLPEEVSMLGELQYLNLARTNITCVNKELGGLKKLEHLILRDCKRLSYVPYGLISQFEKLRVLDLYGCPFIFTTADMPLQNAETTGDVPLKIAEIIADSEEINNEGDEDASQSIQGSTEAEPETNIEELKRLKGRVRGLGLNLDLETISDLQTIFDNASVLKLKLFGLEESDVLDMVELLLKIGKNMDHLNLEKLPRVEELILSNDEDQTFHRLKSLSISGLNCLRKITWNRVSLQGMFPKFETLSIDSCHGLRDLTWVAHLPCLKYLWVHECHGLKEIISDESVVVALPRLKEIHLESLPKLDHICYGRISCPLLTSVCVLQCPMVGEIPFESEGEQSLNINWDTTESTTSVTCSHEWHSGV